MDHLATLWGVHRHTIGRIVAAKGEPVVYAKRPYKNRMTELQQNNLITLSRQENHLNRRQLADRIRGPPQNPPPSPSTIGRVLRQANFTNKRLMTVKEKSVGSEVKGIREQFFKDNPDVVAGYTNPLFHFLDETNRNLQDHPLRGWSEAGTRAMAVVPTGKGAIVPLLIVASCNGIDKYIVKVDKRKDQKKHSIDSVDLRKVLTPLFKKWRRSHHQHVLLMDNAKFHKSALMNIVYDDYPEIDVRYLPPYSSPLNPCESLFSITNSNMDELAAHHGFPRTRATLAARYRSAVEMIDRATVAATFRETAAKAALAARGEEIMNQH
jgi:hypothetical protein